MCSVNTDDSHALYFNGFGPHRRKIIISAELFDTLGGMGVIQVFRGVNGNQIIRYNCEMCLKALQEQGKFGIIREI